MLIKRWNKKDLVAFESLHQRYYAAVLQYACKLTRSAADTNDLVEAEDLATESFLRLWEYHKPVETLAKLNFLLFRTVYTLFVDQIRRKDYQRQVETHLLYEAPTADDVETQMIRAEMYRSLQELIQTLRPRAKTIILRRLDGYSVEEIAKEINTSNKNVYKSLRHSSQRLKALLEQHGII